MSGVPARGSKHCHALAITQAVALILTHPRSLNSERVELSLIGIKQQHRLERDMCFFLLRFRGARAFLRLRRHCRRYLSCRKTVKSARVNLLLRSNSLTDDSSRGAQKFRCQWLSCSVTGSKFKDGFNWLHRRGHGVCGSRTRLAQHFTSCLQIYYLVLVQFRLFLTASIIVFPSLLI